MEKYLSWVVAIMATLASIFLLVAFGISIFSHTKTKTTQILSYDNETGILYSNVNGVTSSITVFIPK